jgi:hypothetical protein
MLGNLFQPTLLLILNTTIYCAEVQFQIQNLTIFLVFSKPNKDNQAQLQEPTFAFRRCPLSREEFDSFAKEHHMFLISITLDY